MSVSKNLHPRDVMLIRQLKVLDWSDEQIWKEYCIPIPIIKKAKEIERQVMEEFNNKEQHAVELAKFKERLKFIIDSADSIAKDNKVSHADRIKFERIKLEALAMLRHSIEASISSTDPYSALEKFLNRAADDNSVSLAAVNRIQVNI